MRGWRIVAVLALAAIAAPSAAAAQDAPAAPSAVAPSCVSRPVSGAGARVALVVANGGYAGGWQPLASPAADQALLVEALRGAGFSVGLLCDGDAAAMRAALADVARHARGAEAALIYFAGHGFEWRGGNFLVPVGAPDAPSPVAPPAGMAQGFVAVDELTAALDGAGVAMILLDACRSVMDEGSADADAATQATMLGNAASFTGSAGAIGFATAHGEPAFDSAPPSYRYSPFAESLADYLPVVGLELRDLFGAVRRDVERRTRVFAGGPQEPWLIDRLGGDFYFLAPVGEAALAARAGAAPAAEAPLDIDMGRLERGDEFGVIGALLATRGAAAIGARAAGGDAAAQYLFAYMLRFGIGVAADPDSSERWLERAAANGDPAALTLLGFERSLYAADAAEEASGQAMLRAAARQGFGRAHYFLGDVDRAAEDGDAYSAFLLADRGEVERGIRLLVGMAELGDEAASAWLCQLAVIHGRAALGVQSCGDAARAGSAAAQASLAGFLAAQAGGTETRAVRHWAALGRPTIFFELDRADVRGFNQQAVVAQLAALLAERPWRRIVLEAHTDQLTGLEYSIALGDRMASSVARQLEAAGIPADRITRISFGSARPVTRGFGIQPLNRRVEIRVEWGEDGE